MSSIELLQGILTELSNESDARKRAELCQRGLSLVTDDERPPLWAALQVELGNSLSDDLSGDRADNLERAIHHYEEALTVYSRVAFPREWAATQNNLAAAYGDRIRGERADNLERAIHHCEEALTVYTR